MLLRRIRVVVGLGLLAAVVMLLFAAVQFAACGDADGDGDQPAPSPAATAASSPTSMPSPTAAPFSILIRLSSNDNPQDPIWLEVVTGDYELASGATARAGSTLAVSQEEMTFPSGLAIDVGSGGVTLGYSTQTAYYSERLYAEGTRLRVAQDGALVEVDDE